MKDKNKSWKWRRAILVSTLPPSARHVLLTLSCFMDKYGESAFPSMETLAKATGLSKKSIIKHIRIAIQEDWIKAKKHGIQGKAWARNEYKAYIPIDFEGGERITPPIGEGGERSTPPDDEGGELSSQGGELEGIKVVNVVHPILSYNSTNNSITSESDDGELSTPPDDESKNPKRQRDDLLDFAMDVFSSKGFKGNSCGIVNKWREAFFDESIEWALGETMLCKHDIVNPVSYTRALLNKNCRKKGQVAL